MLTQRDLAARVNLDFTYLSKIENGTADRLGRPMIPSKDKIIALAKALDVDPDEMLLLADKPSVEDWTKNAGFREFYRTARAHALTKEEWLHLAAQIRGDKKK